VAYSFESRPLWVSTDVVMFTIAERRLRVLLAADDTGASPEDWRFPGGFVAADEELERCAVRTLEEATGINAIYLEQLYTFARSGRLDRERGVTVAYYALVPMDRLRLDSRAGQRGLEWFALDDLPPLPPTIAEVIAMAHERLAAKLDYSTIAFQFMPEKFTLSELQTVYEIILREPLDKRNFRKQILGLDRIEETGEYTRNGSHRPARLYRLRYPDRVEIIK
jgi:8-oxo-dGTP diphosphatase